MTVAVPAPPPLDDGLEQLLRRMRLPHMRRIAPEVIATAKAQRWDPAEVLRALLAEEVAGRDRSSLATRRTRAAFPTGKTFDAWDERLSSVPAPTQAALRTLEWVGRHENLVVCGPSGTGKTFLLEALGQAAVETGKNVAWFTLEQLGALLRRHRADDSVTKAIARILRADLVVVDDIGLLPVGPDAAEGLCSTASRTTSASSKPPATIPSTRSMTMPNPNPAPMTPRRGWSRLFGRRGGLIAVEPRDDRTTATWRAQFRSRTRRRRSPPPRAAVDGDRALGAAASGRRRLRWRPASPRLR